MTFEGSIPGLPGTTVRIVAELPDRLPGAAPAGMYIQACENQLLIAMPGVARYLVRDGMTIDVAPEPGADEGAVAVYLYGSARSALIHQRGELPLHAATLMAPDARSAIALCGASGAGKSTLAAELCRRGWFLVADDTTRVTWNGARAIAWPSHGCIKLWRDACERFGLDTTALERVRAGMDKFMFRVRAAEDPVALTHVVELVTGGAPGVTELNAAAVLDLLSRNTFRPRQVQALGKLAKHMLIVMQVASAARIWQLGQARALGPGELADALEAQLR